ncbi:MAG: cell division topological specificity factor MinE [Lachnospiraceae bacterium]|mgnify:FL=1|nr:cell division topological specificity factor MinE [Lachnospiraceae bacterium]
MNSRRYASFLTSGEIAKNRAGLTVASDRLNASPEELQQMKKEIADILTRYLNLSDAFEIRVDLIQKRNQGVQDVKTIQIK